MKVSLGLGICGYPWFPEKPMTLSQLWELHSRLKEATVLKETLHRLPKGPTRFLYGGAPHPQPWHSTGKWNILPYHYVSLSHSTNLTEITSRLLWRLDPRAADPEPLIRPEWLMAWVWPQNRVPCQDAFSTLGEQVQLQVSQSPMGRVATLNKADLLFFSRSTVSKISFIMKHI